MDCEFKKRLSNELLQNALKTPVSFRKKKLATYHFFVKNKKKRERKKKERKRRKKKKRNDGGLFLFFFFLLFFFFWGKLFKKFSLKVHLKEIWRKLAEWKKVSLFFPNY